MKGIKDWTEEEVEKIFSYHLDDMHPLDAISAKEKFTTLEDKRNYLIREEIKFQNSFK